MCSWVYQNPLAAAGNAQADTLVLQYSHMGMLTLLGNGSLLAAWQAAPVFWEGSRRARACHVQALMARSFSL